MDRGQPLRDTSPTTIRSSYDGCKRRVARCSRVTIDAPDHAICLNIPNSPAPQATTPRNGWSDCAHGTAIISACFLPYVSFTACYVTLFNRLISLQIGCQQYRHHKLSRHCTPRAPVPFGLGCRSSTDTSLPMDYPAEPSLADTCGGRSPRSSARLV